jgi:hypothetical protein
MGRGDFLAIEESLGSLYDGWMLSRFRKRAIALSGVASEVSLIPA